MRTFFSILITFAFFTGCVSTREVMDSYTGHHKSELYRMWGPPNQITTDGDGGEILIYSSYVNFPQTPGTVYNNGYGGINYTTPQSKGYTRTRMFYAHNNGIIYHWRTQGR